MYFLCHAECGDTDQPHIKIIFTISVLGDKLDDFNSSEISTNKNDDHMNLKKKNKEKKNKSSIYQST